MNLGYVLATRVSTCSLVFECLLNVDRLPLDTVMLVISELLPKIQNLQTGRQKANSAGAITDFLQSVTLTDVLPPAPVLYPRRFVVCSSLHELQKILTQRLVVGCINCLVDVAHMGRSLCAWNVASRDMELHQRATLFCEAHTTATAANHRHDVKRRWRAVLAHQTKTRAFVQSVRFDGFVCFWCTVNRRTIHDAAEGLPQGLDIGRVSLCRSSMAMLIILLVGIL